MPIYIMLWNCNEIFVDTAHVIKDNRCFNFTVPFVLASTPAWRYSTPTTINRVTRPASTTTRQPSITGPAVTQDPRGVPPTHQPNGICARFSSALCEHYCHDAPSRPNKFRCTCWRGFELAANQRNCDKTCKCTCVVCTA